MASVSHSGMSGERTLANFGLSLIALLVAIALRWLLDPLLGEQLAFITLFGAVAFAVWLDGYRPALVVVVLGYLACDLLFIEPRGSIAPIGLGNFVGLLAFLATSGLIVGFGEAMRTHQRRAAYRAEALRTTLESIGDAVITTDAAGRVTFLNHVAELLTGWPNREAAGRPLVEIFRIINEQTRQPAENPVDKVLARGQIVGLANHTVLITRDGSERPIDDSAAPIRDNEGQINGVVLVFRDITERRRAEMALRRSEQELADFFDNASVGLHWIGPEGTIDRVNQAELDTLGYGREEYVGRHIAEFHIDQPVIEDILARLQRGETLRDYPARMRAKDGSVRDMLIDSSASFEDGKFIRSRCFARDVTDLKRAQEAQARLAAIVATSDDAIISKSLDGVILSWNAGAERIFGYSAAEAVGQPITILIPPELHDEETTILNRLRRGEQIAHYETTRVAKDGCRIDISLTISPIVDGGGRVVGASKVARDITERKQSEEALRASEERYRAVVEGQAEMLCRFRSDGTILFVNPAYARASGTTAEALVGNNFWDFVPESDQASVRELLSRLSPESPEVHIENRFHTANGLRWTLWTNRALEFDAEGRWLEAQSAGLDITDRKRAEESLQEADRRKDEFLATLAHELRNPLAPISNALEVMKRSSVANGDSALGESGDGPSDARQVMERQVHHLVRLVDDLLDVSRITRDKLELRKERVELSSVIYQAVETCHSLVEGSQLKLTLDLSPDPIYLEADPVRLTQVLGNLLNNACKYTNPGGTVSLGVEQTGGEVLIRVTDNGLGLAPEMLDRVFDLFAQADHSLERARGGLGIGLTLVKRLVEMHGGSVQAMSEGLGRGSEFVVRLPVLVELPERPTARPVALEKLATPRRVLVVDDNRDSATTLAMLLSMTGNNTQTAHDGEAAIAAADQFRPEVLLLDIGLPRMNGYDVCRAIRERPWGDEIVMVAVTGWGQDEDRRRSEEAGFDHHLVKPVDPAAVMEILAAQGSQGNDEPVVPKSE